MKWFIIFLIQVIFLVTAGYLLTIYPGFITINWIGYQAETSLLFFATAVLILSITFGLIFKIIAALIHAPSILKASYQKGAHEKGIRAIVAAISSLLAQDSRKIAEQADDIRRFLHEQDLAKFLEAEAAFYRGDLTTAQNLYEVIERAHGFQFLASQGITKVHLKRGHDAQALEWAQTAQRANKNSAWAHSLIVDLAIKMNNLDLALAELNKLIQLNLGSQQENHRRKAAILKVLAEQAKHDGALEAALTYAEEAYELAPDNRDIVLLYANLLWQQKSEKAAQKIIEQAWASTPDPKLAELYINITHPDSDLNQLKMIRRLASFAPHHPESYLATARVAIDTKQWSEARDILTQLITDGYKTEAVLKLMSQLDKANYAY